MEQENTFPAPPEPVSVPVPVLIPVLVPVSGQVLASGPQPLIAEGVSLAAAASGPLGTSEMVNMERSIVQAGTFSKKVRGRPRKYDLEGRILTPPSGEMSGEKRSRGRPPGALNKRKLVSVGDLLVDSAKTDFTPHLLTIHTGEDLAAKITEIGLMGPKSICVLSCNGSISVATLSRPPSDLRTTYEGRFEILSLNGCIVPNDCSSRGQSSRNSKLSITMVQTNGCFVVGVVAGPLIAASPIQLVLASFVEEVPKVRKKKKILGSPLTPLAPAGSNVATMVTPVSELRPEDDTCRASTSAMHEDSQSQGDAENSNSTSSGHIHSTVFVGVAWNNHPSNSNQKASPDINAHVAHE